MITNDGGNTVVKLDAARERAADDVAPPTACVLLDRMQSIIAYWGIGLYWGRMQHQVRLTD